MRDLSFSGYGFLPFGKRDKGQKELTLKEQLIERFDQRYKEHQDTQRFIAIGSLAMALSAFKHDAVVQGSYSDHVFGNTAASDIYKGHLGNDIYSYLMSGIDTITDTGVSDELRVSVVDAGGVSVQKSFKRVGDNKIVVGTGNYILSGGEGFDEFVSNTNDGKDVIGALSSGPLSAEEKVSR